MTSSDSLLASTDSPVESLYRLSITIGMEHVFISEFGVDFSFACVHPLSPALCLSVCSAPLSVLVSEWIHSWRRGILSRPRWENYNLQNFLPAVLFFLLCKWKFRHFLCTLQCLSFLDALASLETTHVSQWVSHPQFRQSHNAVLRSLRAQMNRWPW